MTGAAGFVTGAAGLLAGGATRAFTGVGAALGAVEPPKVEPVPPLLRTVGTALGPVELPKGAPVPPLVFTAGTSLVVLPWRCTITGTAPDAGRVVYVPALVTYTWVWK